MPLHHTVEDGVIQTHQVDFDYTGTAFNMAQIPAGATILQAYVIVFSGFDDGAATLEIGDSADSDGLVPSSDADITTAAMNINDIGISPGAAINPIVTISPGTSTQGEGRVIISYIVS